MADTPSITLLEAFADAWNRHDLTDLMSMMHSDCAFETAVGPHACGTRHVGREAVARAFEAVWKLYPDARWNGATHFLVGDRGASEWTFTGTAADGTRVEVDGVDVFTFRDGRILLKDTYRKQRQPQS